MYTTYIIGKKTKIQGFFHTEWLTSGSYKKCYDKFDYRFYKGDGEYIEDKEYTTTVNFIDDVPYVTILGEKVNLLDFYYHNISVLIDEIKWGIKHDDRWFVKDDIILASLMKQPNSFGVKLKPNKFTFVFPQLGFGACEQSEDEVIYIPKIGPMREIHDWHYKIDLWAKEEELRQFYAHQEYYFSDFCSLLKAGIINLIEL